MKTRVPSDKNVAQLAHEFLPLAVNFGIEIEAKTIHANWKEDKDNAVKQGRAPRRIFDRSGPGYGERGGHSIARNYIS